MSVNPTFAGDTYPYNSVYGVNASQPLIYNAFTNTLSLFGINSIVSDLFTASGDSIPTSLAVKNYVDYYFKLVEWMPHIQSIWDPSGGLPPTPNDLDRYIASSTANGWTVNNIYEYFVSAGTWTEFIPKTGWSLWNKFNNTILTFSTNQWLAISSGMATKFIDLTDCPHTYTTPNSIYTVNATNNGVQETTIQIIPVNTSTIQLSHGTLNSSINQSLLTTDNTTFNKLILNSFDDDTLSLPNNGSISLLGGNFKTTSTLQGAINQGSILTNGGISAKGYFLDAFTGGYFQAMNALTNVYEWFLTTSKSNARLYTNQTNNLYTLESRSSGATPNIQLVLENKNNSGLLLGSKTISVNNSGNVTHTCSGTTEAFTPIIEANGGIKMTNTVTEFSIDGTMASNSDSKVPTEKAIRTYVSNNGGAPALPLNSLQYNNAGAFGGSSQYIIDSSDTNASKIKIVSPNSSKFLQLAVDQLWNIGQIYNTANNLELWTNSIKGATLQPNGQFVLYDTSGASSVTLGQNNTNGLTVSGNISTVGTITTTSNVGAYINQGAINCPNGGISSKGYFLDAFSGGYFQTMSALTNVHERKLTTANMNDILYTNQTNNYYVLESRSSGANPTVQILLQNKDGSGVLLGSTYMSVNNVGVSTVTNPSNDMIIQSRNGNGTGLITCSKSKFMVTSNDYGNQSYLIVQIGAQNGGVQDGSIFQRWALWHGNHSAQTYFDIVWDDINKGIRFRDGAGSAWNAGFLAFDKYVRCTQGFGIDGNLSISNGANNVVFSVDTNGYVYITPTGNRIYNQAPTYIDGNLTIRNQSATANTTTISTDTSGYATITPTGQRLYIDTNTPLYIPAGVYLGTSTNVLSVYNYDQPVLTFTGNGTVNITFRCVRVGNNVTLSCPLTNWSGTTFTTQVSTTGIPSQYRPSTLSLGRYIVYASGSGTTGTALMEIAGTTGIITLYRDMAGNAWVAGNNAVQISVSYNVA